MDSNLKKYLAELTETVKDCADKLDAIRTQIERLDTDNIDTRKPDFGKFKVVSFDVFDTVILRPFARPIDAFALVGGAAFANARRNAEIAARRKFGREVNLSEIYASGNLYGQDAEIEAELASIAPNPQGLELYRAARRSGARIVFTSDFYCSATVIAMFLGKIGITEYERIFVSADFGTFKSQKLFDIVLREMKVLPAEMIHLGDNQGTDIKPAAARGIATFKLEKRIDKFRAENPQIKFEPMTPARSHWLGLLANDSKPRGVWEAFGFATAVYVWAYARAIYRRAKIDGVRNLLFVMRDGFTLKKYFDRLDAEGQFRTEYVYANRRMALDRKDYSDYRSSLRLEGKTAIVDNVTGRHSAQTVLNGADDVGYVLFCHAHSSKFKTVQMLSSRGYLCGAPLDLCEMIFSAPVLPILGVEKFRDNYNYDAEYSPYCGGVYRPIYDAKPSQDEKKKTEVVRKICAGQKDFNPRPEIEITLEEADEFVREYIANLSDSARAEIESLKNSTDPYHRKFKKLNLEK